MNCLNSVLLEGTVARGPYLSETPQGDKVCVFAIESTRKDQVGDTVTEEVSYFDVEATRRLAERCAEELTKGRGVRAHGRLRQDRWDDADGIARSHIRIVVDHVEFSSIPQLA